MTFRRLLDRTVTIVPRVVSGEDSHGNQIRVDGTPIVGVPAGRDLEQADEVLEDRDQQNRRWIYFLPPALDDGTPVELDGYARILDGDDVLEVVGEPDLIVRRRRPQGPHHWEVTAERRS